MHNLLEGNLLGYFFLLFFLSKFSLKEYPREFRQFFFVTELDCDLFEDFFSKIMNIFNNEESDFDETVNDIKTIIYPERDVTLAFFLFCFLLEKYLKNKGLENFKTIVFCLAILISKM